MPTAWRSSLNSYLKFNEEEINTLKCLGISTQKRNTPYFSSANTAGKVICFFLFFTILKVFRN